MPLTESYLNPKVRLADRRARMQSPNNRAAMLGNDATGMTHYYSDLAMNTFDELKPVVRKNHTTWNIEHALANLPPDKVKLSELVHPDRRDDFWYAYKELRTQGFTRKQVLIYILRNATHA